MTLDEVMGELERLGTEQNRKTYRRHGASEPLFGVSYAHIGALQKRIKTDQALADALWATGNADARTLATMIADPSRFTLAQLDAWVKSIHCHGLADGLTLHVASKSRFAREAAERWMASGDEQVARAGWNLVGHLAAGDPSLPDAFFERHIATIQAGIHAAQNRVREAMNTALINIGARNEALRQKAIAAAKRIGKVEVDHGDTACKTRDAIEYIEKMWARRAMGSNAGVTAATRAAAKKAAAKKAPAEAAARKTAPAKAPAKKAPEATRAPAKKAAAKKAAAKKAQARAAQARAASRS